MRRFHRLSAAYKEGWGVEVEERIRMKELEKEVESLKLRNAALERALSKIATAILPVIGELNPDEGGTGPPLQSEDLR